jgi:anthranilate phosphoribosyltransferase
LVGVFAPRWLVPMAETLGALGAERVWVVHGCGTDELTLAGETEIAEWRDGALHLFTVTPEQAGLERAPLSAIAGGDAASNAAALAALLQGGKGAYRDTVVFNSAAALMVAGHADTLRQGACMAEAALDNGAAHTMLRRLQTAGQKLPALD